MQIAVLNNTSENFSAQSWKKFRSLFKGDNLKKFDQIKTFLLKKFQWTRRMQFWHSGQNTLDKIQYFPSMCDNDNFFFQKKTVFPGNVPLGLRNSVLATPLQILEKHVKK